MIVHDPGTTGGAGVTNEGFTEINNGFAPSVFGVSGSSASGTQTVGA
jgi:hypothetical protein